jgi:hypothetical protein
MESMNRTIVPAVTPTVPAEGSMRLHLSGS